MSNYSAERAKELKTLTHAALRELPDVCTDFILAIDSTTQPLTRYAYVADLKLFFGFLTAELPKFAGKDIRALEPSDLARVTSRDIHIYMDYLGLYYKDDTEFTNAELGKMRKLSSLRSFYKFLYKNGYVDADPAALVDMSKRHQKPIIRLEIDEVARMLDIVESGEMMPEHKAKYNLNTNVRDLAILTLFLGTGIRVSELVGINISDIDFSINGFLVTRKGGNQAILYFPDEVADVLKNYLRHRMELTPLPGHEDALFLSLQNKRISVRAVQVMVKKYASLAAPLKKHLSPHQLRSTFRTNLYHETGDIYLVADVLSHSDVNTTRRHYAAMSDDRRRMAATKVRLRDETPTEKAPEAPAIDGQEDDE